MIFNHSLRRDLASLAGIVFSTLFTIMVTTTLIRMLGRASAGSVDTASVLPLIAFASINVLPVLLVLTLFISVLMSLTRAFRDSEMVIWFASGQSLTAWIRPVLGFALPFAIAIGAVGFVVAPWANQQASEYQRSFEQREDVSQIAPGQFRESRSTDRVFFVESVNEADRTVRNVFVTQTRGQEFSVVVSSKGFVDQSKPDYRFLVLEKGRRYDSLMPKVERPAAVASNNPAATAINAAAAAITGRAAPDDVPALAEPPPQPALRITEFERYGVRLDPKPVDFRDDSTRVKSTLELMRDPAPRNLGELAWRISLPVSAVLLALLAIPMSFVNPRVGRSINLVVALLLYVIYNNFASVTQAWIAQDRLPFSIGVWAIHALLAVLVAILFMRRTRLPRFRLANLWARR